MCIAVYVHVYITQIYTKHYGLDTHVSQNTHAHAHPNTVYVVAVVMLLALGFLILAPRLASNPPALIPEVPSVESPPGTCQPKCAYTYMYACRIHAHAHNDALMHV
jgi:quinol-cytochrome oxidoreductase complex cytochrome b subunit